MAPEACLSITAAEKRALAGEVESQDSQLVAMKMHQIHGIGLRSSSPVQPLLPKEAGVYQQRQDILKPPKVHQRTAGAGSFPQAPEPASPNSKHTNVRGSEATYKSTARPLGRPNISKNPENPAVNATHKDRDKGKGSGSVAGPAASLANPANLIPVAAAQARIADASRNRVSHPSLTIQQSDPAPAQIHQTACARLTLAHPIDSADAANHHPNEVNPTSLNAAAAAPGARTVNPAFLGLRNDEDDGSNHGDGSGDDHVRHNPSPGQDAAGFILRPRRSKMESSQSPTQSNEGRSYEQYLPRGDDLISTDPLQEGYLSQQSRISSPTSNNEDGDENENENENVTLNDDDTGAVNFDFSNLGRRDTQVSVPDPLEITGNPETPAPPKNPFAQSKAPLMASSQMFRHTQFSSAYKTFSPTSSRPSPDNLTLNRSLNSISPNPSPLKKAALGPSPLHGAPSSLAPFPLALDTSPQQTEPDHRPSLSSPFPQRRPSAEVYQPIHHSQDLGVRESAESDLDTESGSGEDVSDGETRRRQHQRVLRRKAAASKRLQAISFERRRGTSEEDVVVPSTSKDDMRSPVVQQCLNQYEGISTKDSQYSVEDTQGVQDSQDGIVRLSADLVKEGRLSQRVGNVSSNDAVVPNTDPALQAQAENLPITSETSPAYSDSHLRALDDRMAHSLEDGLRADSSLPVDSQASKEIEALTLEVRSSPPTPAEKVRTSRRQPAVAAKASRSSADADADAPAPNPAPTPALDTPALAIASSPPAPAFSTRARLRRHQAPATALPTSSGRPTSSGSPLSKLSTTPALSDRSTLITADPPRPELTPSSTNDVGSSPAVDKARRRKSAAIKAATKNGVGRASTRRTRKSFASDISTTSTDELAKSPARSTPPTFEQSTRFPRLGRTALREPPASREASRGVKIFAGMAFAISFQAKQQGEKDPQYNARMALSGQITTKIKQGGGRILDDGFDILFDTSLVKNADRDREAASSTPVPDDEIKLAPTARETGFTALIADGHSRKVKYMQALALGLPCIHDRWITTCVERQQLVDWSDYLLCAGNSSFLGDAIKSRTLPCYDAASAKLREVIQDRPRLLHSSRILLVMSRADESKKAAYVFLARVLGASLSRVYTIDDARKQLKAREDAGHPFDWVYVDEKMTGRADLFADSVTPPSTSKKRKRKIELGAPGPAPKKIRTLSDELVIQSLILGRLMGAEEMVA